MHSPVFGLHSPFPLHTAVWITGQRGTSFGESWCGLPTFPPPR